MFELHHFPRAHNGECFQYINDFHLYDNKITMVEVFYGHWVVGLLLRETIVVVIPEYYHGCSISPPHPQ